jgi:hypothetical protein
MKVGRQVPKPWSPLASEITHRPKRNRNRALENHVRLFLTHHQGGRVRSL